MIFGREGFEKIAGEQLDVLAALAQGRQLQIKHVQPIKQILAQLAFFYRRWRLAVGRGDDAHRDWNVFVAADAAYLAFLEHAQKFWLHFRAPSR